MKATAVFLAVALSWLSLSAAPARAAILVYVAHLDGPSESPPVPSPATGFVSVDYDSVAHTLVISATWKELVGTTTVAHIHAPTAVAFTGTVGVATYPGTLPGFPGGVTVGTYVSPSPIDLTDTSSYTAGFLALGGGTAGGAEALLLTSLSDGKAYFNIHTSFAPGGEIRGFLQETPEPSSLALFSAAALGLTGYLRRRAAKQSTQL